MGWLGLTLTFHVFTPDGDLYVSDSNDGDRVLQSLVTQYPSATVIVKDRNTGKALGIEMPLLQLLQQERGFLSVDIQRGVQP